jgi:hypothetical protein
MGWSPIDEFLDDVSVTRSGPLIIASERRSSQTPELGRTLRRAALGAYILQTLALYFSSPLNTTLVYLCDSSLSIAPCILHSILINRASEETLLLAARIKLLDRLLERACRLICSTRLVLSFMRKAFRQ